MKRLFNKYKVLLVGLLMVLTLEGFNFQTPKVFVIGDSISIYYGPYLKNSLKGFFSYDRKKDKGEALKNLDNPVGANGGDSGMVLAYLKELVKDKDFKTDYLLVNCGLHDIKRKSPRGNPQVNLIKYKSNLSEIIYFSKVMDVKLIWVNSTPVADSIHNRRVPFYRFNQDLINYNKAADSIMLESKIPVIDLYSFTEKYIPQAYIDHIHYKKDIRGKQADFIAGSLIAISNCKRDE